VNCREVGPRIQALADDQIGPAHRREVEEHLGGCATCAKAAEEARQNVSFLVDRLAHLRGAVKIDLSGLEAAPAAPVRSHVGDSPVSKKVPMLLIVVAVVIALAVAAFFLFRGGGEEEPTEQGRAVNVDTRDVPMRSSEPHRSNVTPETESKTPADAPSRPAEEPTHQPKTGAPVRIGVAAMLPVFKNRPTQRNLERAWEALAANTGYSLRLIDRIEGTEDVAFRALLVLVLAADNQAGDTRDALFKVLAEDGAPQVRTAAGAALARSTADGAEMLPVRNGLAVPVGRIHDRETLKKLLAAAEAERDLAVVATLIRAVGPSQGPDGAISSRLVELARSESEVVRNAAFQALRASPPADSRVLLRLIEDKSLPIESRAELVPGLSQGREAVTNLSSIIRGAEEVPLKVAAVGALGHCWDKYARIELLETLRSASIPEVRRAAIAVLTSNPTHGSIEILEEIAEKDADRGTRMEAKRAAAEIQRILGPETDSESGE
jgi:hypothetical protein